MSKRFLDILTEMMGKGKWIKKESEQTILAIAWPLLYPIRISTEKELQLSSKLDKTKGTAFREGCLDSMFCPPGHYIKITTGRTY